MKFSSFDDDVLEKFKRYIYDIKGLEDASWDSLVKNLKVMFKWAKKENYHDNTYHQNWKRKPTSPTVIALTYDEYLALRDFQFNNERLQKAVDCFIFSCCTGLRYSDLKRVGPDYIQGKSLVMITSKTNEEVRIPLVETGQQILKKYQGQLPLPSNQKYNEYLKEAAKLAGLNSMRTLKRSNTKGGQITRPLFEILTGHMARKTVVSVSVVKGLRNEQVKSITGHKDEKSYARYLQADTDEMSNKMNSIW